MNANAAKILVATDFSDGADEAIRQADRWAKETKAGLVACHVVPYFLRSAPYMTQWQRKDSTDLLELQQRAAEELSRRVVELTSREEGDFEVFVDSGAPDAAILKAAKELGATMIVIGAHGTTGIAGLRLGNVAQRVVSYAHVPVLLARPAPGAGGVLAATDLSKASLPVVSVGGEVARQRGTKLTVLHVLDLQTVPGAWFGPGPLSAKAWGAERGLAEKQLRDAMEQAGVEGEAKVIEGLSAREIVAEAERLGAELVVIATHGRTGLARMALGSVAKSVIHDAPCSVLILRRPKTS